MLLNKPNNYQPPTHEQKLLDGWEEAFKKGQLTLWIMLALKDSPKHMAAIKTFISSCTNGILLADDRSMYRALRRYYEVGLVDFEQAPGQNGPDRKVYQLTPTGQSVLRKFVERNILNVFFKSDIMKLLKEET